MLQMCTDFFTKGLIIHVKFGEQFVCIIKEDLYFRLLLNRNVTGMLLSK